MDFKTSLFVYLLEFFIAALNSVILFFGYKIASKLFDLPPMAFITVFVSVFIISIMVFFSTILKMKFIEWNKNRAIRREKKKYFFFVKKSDTSVKDNLMEPRKEQEE